MDASHLKTRRDFLKVLIKWGFSLLSVLFGIAVLRFLYPSRIKSREVKFYYILEEDELPVQGVKKVELSYNNGEKAVAFRTFLVNNGSGAFALSPACSHLGCFVEWSRHKRQFVCPCHEGRYDIEGRVIAGPPALPLTRIPLRINDGKAYIGLKA